jgi:hypothetical protein
MIERGRELADDPHRVIEQRRFLLDVLGDDRLAGLHEVAGEPVE